MSRIVHTIEPVFDSRSRVLVLGSLPSPKSREIGFYYGNPHNRFWSVLAALAEEPLPSTVERKRDFCLRHHIALWDVVAECDIDGASDASIRAAQPNNLQRIASAAPIEAVFCTGAKSYELYNKLGCEAITGLPATKLPSTSPANAAYGLSALTEAYRPVFCHAHPFIAPTLDVQHVVELEQAIAANGTSLAELMDRAGTALAHRAERFLHERAEREGAAGSKAEIVVLCGNGNNGGDGWVAAELLAHAGHSVHVVCAKPLQQLTAQPAHDAAVRSLASLEAVGTDVQVNPSVSRIEELLQQAVVIIDALLGTGFAHNAVREPFASWIEATNTVHGNAVVIAADIPSGVNAQTGALATPHIVADETVTMIVAKPGLSAASCGNVTVAPLAYIEPFLEPEAQLQGPH